MAGCARPTAQIMPMRAQPLQQLERDQKACEARANTAVPAVNAAASAATGTLVGVVVGVGAGAIVGVMIVPAIFPNYSTSDPRDLGLVLGFAASVGAALGFFIGGGRGALAATEEARGAWLRVFGGCMHDRGYAVTRDGS
jgi:nitrate/nitrite transporter NarK